MDNFRHQSVHFDILSSSVLFCFLSLALDWLFAVQLSRSIFGHSLSKKKTEKIENAESETLRKKSQSAGEESAFHRIARFSSHSRTCTIDPKKRSRRKTFLQQPACVYARKHAKRRRWPPIVTRMTMMTGKRRWEGKKGH